MRRTAQSRRQRRRAVRRPLPLLPLFFCVQLRFGFCERSLRGTRYDAAIDKSMTTFGPGGPTVEGLEFVVEMVRYRAEVRRRINEAASRELEEKLERAKRARI